MMDSTEGTGSSELRKLADLISNPGRRRAFADDPEKTSSDAGINVAALPDGVRSTLFDLSHEELEVISRVKDGLTKAGVSKEDQAEIF